MIFLGGVVGDEGGGGGGGRGMEAGEKVIHFILLSYVF